MTERSLNDTTAAPANGMLWLSLLVLATAFALPLPHDHRLANLPSWCPFLNLTSWPCPFCGLTRATVCAAHGEWSAAWHYHLLGPPLFALLVLSSTRCLVQTCRRRETRITSNRFFWWTLTAFFVVAWLIRLIGWWPLPQ